MGNFGCFLAAVALGMPPGKNKVPGPMVEDGPPLKVPVEDVAPVPEDKQEIQRMVALEARNITYKCIRLKCGKDSCFSQKYDLKCCNCTFQPDGGTIAPAFPTMTGVTGCSEGQRGPTMLRFGQKSSKTEHQMFL